MHNKVLKPIVHTSSYNSCPTAVKAIKREHLVEIRALRNPPKLVKTALESVCLLLGQQTTDWKEIRSIIMKDNFIPDIVKFSTEDIRYRHFSLILYIQSKFVLNFLCVVKTTLCNF